MKSRSGPGRFLEAGLDRRHPTTFVPDQDQGPGPRRVHGPIICHRAPVAASREFTRMRTLEPTGGTTKDRAGPPQATAAGQRSVAAVASAWGKAGSIPLRLLSTYGTIMALVLMIVVFAGLQPGTFATFVNFRNIFNDMAIATIIAAGLTVPLVGGDFDLSIGYVSSFAGLLVVGILSNNQWPIPLAMIAVIAIGTLIGIVNGVIVSKVGVNAFIATLGTGTIVVGLNYAYSGGIPLQLTH